MRKSFPVNLRTNNRDFRRSPAELKSQHINTGRFSKFTIGPTWVATGSFTVRREAILYGALLSPEWLRVKDLGTVSTERLDLIRGLLRLRGDVSISVTLKDDDTLAKRLKTVKVDKLVRFKRTAVTFCNEFGTVLAVYKEAPEEDAPRGPRPKAKEKLPDPRYVALNEQFANVFTLRYLWSDGETLYDNPDPSEVNVLFQASGSLPEEAAFAIYQAKEQE